MKLLVACEQSGVVRNAFLELGWDAWSCDLEPSDDDSDRHIQGDALEVLDRGWDLLIGHPPCTSLAVSGRWYWNAYPEATQEALDFVQALMDAPVRHIAIENPVSIISTRIRKPDQIIQPWMFGHDASKKTCLWLKNLPKLEATEVIVKSRYANQTPSGQNKLGPSKDRAKLRARTYEGVAHAMAEQWSKFCEGDTP